MEYLRVARFRDVTQSIVEFLSIFERTLVHAGAVTNSPPIDGKDGCSRLTLVRRAELVIILPLRDTLSIAEIIVGHFVPGLDSQLRGLQLI